MEGRANARGDAERAIAQVATLLTAAETRLKSGPPPARGLKGPQAAIATAGKALQEARSALGKEDYAAVDKALAGVADGLQAALTQIDSPAVPVPVRRKR